MSSFIAKLYLDDKVYALLNYNLTLTKYVNNVGNPEGTNLERKLYLTIESQGINTSNLLHWAISPSETKDGRIVFLKRDGISKLQEIQLKKAYCINFQEVFNTTNTEPMYIALTITYGILCGSEISSKLTFLPIVDSPKQKKEKEIVEISIVDEKFKKVKDLGYYQENFNLLVQTLNYEEGEKVTLTIHREDNQKKEISGIVEKDGFIRIKNITLEKTVIPNSITT